MVVASDRPGTPSQGLRISGGILSSLLPNDSPLSDFGNTLPGKILSGIAGAKPSAPQSAGNTQQHVQAPNAETFAYSMSRLQQQHQHQHANLAYPSPKGN